MLCLAQIGQCIVKLVELPVAWQHGQGHAVEGKVMISTTFTYKTLMY